MGNELVPKLLELTRDHGNATFHDLAESLHTNVDNVRSNLTDLANEGLATIHGEIVELSAIQRVTLAEQLILRGSDPHRITRTLNWKEFEDFAVETLERNDFRTAKHVVFKSSIGRREIDLLAWNESFLLVIDCKHWSRGLTYSSARQVAKAQVERTKALAGRLDVLGKHGLTNAENHMMIPVILCLNDPREGISEGVPIVAVSRVISFLYSVSPADESLRIIPCEAGGRQSKLT